MRLRSHAIVWFWIGTEPSMRQRTLATLANGLGLRTLHVSDENVRKAKTNLNIHISITDFSNSEHICTAAKLRYAKGR